MAKKKVKKHVNATTDSSALKTAWNFPKNTLEDAISLAKAIEEKNAGKPLDSLSLAQCVGFNQAKDWRYLTLLRSANMYGLVSGTGATAQVSLEELGQGVVAPSNPEQRKHALAKAFQNVELFKKVSDYYSGKRIPEDEYLANTLTREFDVPRDRVELFTEIFLRNLEYLKSFAATPVVQDGSGKPDGAAPSRGDRKLEKCTNIPTSEAREFLDTCFVLMPFGGWYDKYYDEIYKPAIKDAGFEPVRADDLFHTGSVMEQIWHQVKKAGVLLAELTGKNANVFYELGLAHAVGKPVVFITGSMDDVPFDLRHLRVIPYDIRNPRWSDKLKEGITAYLRNTKKNPTAAIPQPYREIVENRSQPEESPEQDEAEEIETTPIVPAK
jgi:hypothetical protein